MKSKVKLLIDKKHIELAKLKTKQETAAALGFHTQCSALTSEMNQIKQFIEDLSELI